MELAAYCNTLAQAASAAGNWVERNAELVRNERESLLKELRWAGRLFAAAPGQLAAKCAPGFSVQARLAKSYLISALARGKNALEAVFGGQRHDFISEINPEGGKESTGLVTRFTLTQSDAPAAYPVRLAMLSETDIVKILANTYFADCEHKEKAQSNIAETLAKLRGQAGNTPNGEIDLDDMEDLREYLVNDFRSKARTQELERDFWDEAMELGPKLNLEGRVRLYALIWDEVEELTGLLRKLLEALNQLGHPETCFASLDALIPRDKSIIDVATLAGLENGEPDIELITPLGKQAKLPRAVVAALTAELTIVIAEKPADYFEHTDLLDFPGYRSRYKLDDIRRELKKDGMLKELFLRGKVAYLFQRYCAQRELNSMLLCIGPSNQEVQDLPGVINAWIAGTHGPTPQDRVGKRVSLFFILTKFDVEFEDKKGAPSLDARWDNRLHASLLDFFGKQHDWPTQWTPGHGFVNMFLLRNPNYRFEAIMDFDGDTETGIRPQRLDYVEKLKSAFLSSKLVAEHFQDPARAWNEAMRLNDGGISFIRESLTPVCDPAIKEEQLLQNINACREALARRLEVFFQTDDHEEARRQKTRLIVNLFKTLGTLENQRRRLGQLIRSFTINEDEILALHPLAIRRLREADIEPAQASEPAAENLDLANLDLGALNPFGEEAQEKNEAIEQKQDEAAAYSAIIESKWVEKLHSMANNPELQNYFMLPPPLFSALAAELATGVERLKIRESLTQSFRQIAAYANTQKGNITCRQAAFAARAINDFVDWLGYNPLKKSENERAVALSTGKPAIVFTRQPELNGLPDIGESRQGWTQKWFQDWLNAMAGLILDNVNFDGASTFNAVENAALGEILKKLTATPANA